MKRYRLAFVALSLIALMVSFLSAYGYIKYSNFTDSLIFLSGAYFIISIVVCFLDDNIFKKWSIFALIWLFASLYSISRASNHAIGLLDSDREQVSIWMSSLFLIISIVMIIIWTIQEKRKSKK